MPRRMREHGRVLRGVLETREQPLADIHDLEADRIRQVAHHFVVGDLKVFAHDH